MVSLSVTCQADCMRTKATSPQLSQSWTDTRNPQQSHAFRLSTLILHFNNNRSPFAVTTVDISRSLRAQETWFGRGILPLRLWIPRLPHLPRDRMLQSSWQVDLLNLGDTTTHQRTNTFGLYPGIIHAFYERLCHPSRLSRRVLSCRRPTNRGEVDQPGSPGKSSHLWHQLGGYRLPVRVQPLP